MKANIVLILLILCPILQIISASAEINNSTIEYEMNKTSISEKTSIIEFAVFLVIVVLLSILISIIVEFHRNFCKTKNHTNSKNNLKNRENYNMDDLNIIIKKATDENLHDITVTDNYIVENNTEDKLMEIKIDKHLYKKLLSRSNELKMNPFDLLKEIIEKGLKDK